MGKKKRKIPYRGAASKQKEQAVRELWSEDFKHADRVFKTSCDRVCAILTSFHPLDALSAVNVSDLWHPNRASQTKHQLTFSLLVSLRADSFTCARMTSYEQFSGFFEALKKALPSFPTLEDYVPEPDWGDVKAMVGQESLRILHGGPVQRIIDHMEAFRIVNGEGSQAVAELDSAIRLQAELIRRIPNNSDVGRRPVAGHMELPPESFWEVAMPALKVPFVPIGPENRYVVELGQDVSWNGASGFGDAILAGSALPWQFVRIDGSLYAMSLRNAASIVIDAWCEAPQGAPDQLAARLNSYLAKRISGRTCLPGPLWLRARAERAPLPIAAVLTEEGHHFMIVPVLPSQWSHAGRAVETMRRLMQDRNWGLQLQGTLEGFQLGEGRGAAYGPDAVNIVLVKTQMSTTLSVTRSPSPDARLIGLVDACTIIDSIDSVEEFGRFWTYVDGIREMGGGAFSDLGDMFGSFRDVHGQILDGAVIPNFLALDPHWGASWRYQQLKEFWEQAPEVFPDERSAWQTHERRAANSLMRVTAKNAPRIAWSSVIGDCTLHFVLDVIAVGLEPEDGRLLELFIQCAADSIAERAGIIAAHLQLPFRRIKLDCFGASHLLPSSSADQSADDVTAQLIVAWEEAHRVEGDSYEARVTVNLARLVHGLKDNEDACFEVVCAQAVAECLFEVLGKPMPKALGEALAGTAGNRPRFTLSQTRRTVDVPDFTDPQSPKPEDYKVARRDLAFLLKGQGVFPGTYMLDEGKALINAARTAYRDAVHQRIRALDRDSLLSYCVEQYDAMIAANNREEWRLKLSLRHEVDFDREQGFAEAHDKFVRQSKNFRYLLESAIVLARPQPSPVSASTVMPLLAMIDWLFVLYGASDVLHNGIDVGGLQVDDQFVPEVIYSGAREAQEDAFRREQAALRLGVNVTEEDRLGTALSTEAYMAALDAAFRADLGFSYGNLLHVLSTLTLWVSVGGEQELACRYTSDRRAVAEQARLVHSNLSMDAALKALDFLVLAPDQSWRLIGVDAVTDDVPVWEHAKRGSRHTIRPLIALADGRLLWGAAAVERTLRIWTGSIASGYLPADYPWPAVREAVGQLKKELEDGLEDRAHEVCARVMPYALKGINFKHRFPKERFPDIGDFDVLAYHPEENRWLTVECKYNQPAFSLKDTRRLRDRIFGGGSERGQLRKIEGRREFLTKNLETLRSLLGWPAPADKPFSLTELYVSKDIHFWLRFPPYEVPTHFVQIDTLHAWLEQQGIGASRLPSAA